LMPVLSSVYSNLFDISAIVPSISTIIVFTM
jgi:hypothetical protein